MTAWGNVSKIIDQVTFEEGNIQDWNDVKVFDNDHDPEWFKEAEENIREEYGSFVNVRYTSQGKPGYYCEICYSEMNGLESLEAHCSGMKHLKKKDVWMKEQKRINDDGTTKRRVLEDVSKRGDKSKQDKAGDTPRHTPCAPPILPSLLSRSITPPPRRPRSPARRPRSPPPRPRSPPPRPRSPPPRPKTPPPQKVLTPTETLLKQLATPCIQDKDDEELAMQVLNSLTKALREYNHRKGSESIADLLMEAELKYSTALALNATLEDMGTVTAQPPPNNSMTSYY